MDLNGANFTGHNAIEGLSVLQSCEVDSTGWKYLVLESSVRLIV